MNFIVLCLRNLLFASAAFILFKFRFNSLKFYFFIVTLRGRKCSRCSRRLNSLHRRFDFINHSQFLNIFMNIANEQSRRQLNETENPHQFIAAARHVTDCNCEINNQFMNFFPFKLNLNSNRLRLLEIIVQFTT